MEPSTLALFWVGVLGCAILLYVILDGFDLAASGCCLEPPVTRLIGRG
jgi:cytochrome bd-type quinol oxidase subunit 2